MPTPNGSPSIDRGRPSFASTTGVRPSSASALTGIEIEEFGGNDVARQTVITFTNTVVAMTDGTTSGSIGAIPLYTLPQGLIGIKLLTTRLTAARVGTAITAGTTIKHSVGTAIEATNDTLDSTQANVVASTNITEGSTTPTIGVNTAYVVVNGTASAGGLWLNFGVADAGSSGNDSITVNGRVTITWENGGY